MSINLAYPALPAAARIRDGLVVASCNGDIRSRLEKREFCAPEACKHRWLQEAETKSSASVDD